MTRDALRSFSLSKKLRRLSGCDFADGPDKQFRFLFGVVRRESDPDPAADPVYAHPVGERFRVIIPIGGKDAVSVAEFPAYVAGLLPFQRKGDGGGLGAFGLVQRQAGDIREPLPDDAGEGVSCRSMRSKPETRRSRRVEPVPSPAMSPRRARGRNGLMALRPGLSLPGAVEGAGWQR